VQELNIIQDKILILGANMQKILEEIQELINSVPDPTQYKQNQHLLYKIKKYNLHKIIEDALNNAGKKEEKSNLNRRNKALEDGQESTSKEEWNSSIQKHQKEYESKLSKITESVREESDKLIEDFNVQIDTLKSDLFQEMRNKYKVTKDELEKTYVTSQERINSIYAKKMEEARNKFYEKTTGSKGFNRDKIAKVSGGMFKGGHCNCR